jgi:serine/threonine protein kinase
MELCVASLDQLFLVADDPKKYKEPIPSDEQFGFQLISALEYIHGKNLVHGSIKPTNILISSSEDPQIKLSDFGLTTTCLNDGHSSKRVICGFLSSRYWLAPELLECDSTANAQSTKESDIFSAGSVFFYFLSKGCHLFGNATHEIIPNILKGIQKNVFSKLSIEVTIHLHVQISLYVTITVYFHYIEMQTQIGYFSIIPWMTTIEPKRRSTLSEVTEQMKLLQPPSAISFKKTPTTIGNVEFFTSHIIGTGGQASVFHGFSNGFAVAVKRIIIDAVEKDKKSIVYRERDLFQKLKHRNIVKLVDCGENEIFM